MPQNGPLVEELVKFNVEVIVTELAVLRREYFSVSGILQFVNNIFKSLRLVYSKQKNLNVIAFHSNTSAMWTGFLAAWVFRKKHFWQVMEIIESPQIVSWIMSRVVGIFSHKVFCISDAVRTHFLKSNSGREDKFITIYHGVDRSIYDVNNIDRNKVRQLLNLESDTILIGFAGRFNAWKGQEVLAFAAKKVLSEMLLNKKIHFLFLGSVFADQYIYKTELKSLLNSSHQLKSHSTLLGFQKDFQNWLGAMDIFVLPSKLPEPNATVTIAAMSLGIPVVGTNIGGTIESVVDGYTGFLVPPNDTELLADKICVLINSPDIRLKFGKNALDRANDIFSINAYSEKVLAFYEK